ncbi:MAG: response regulator [Pseudomonadota bacterium]|nr:response regulator [Pseudomonadota bacterium]
MPQKVILCVDDEKIVLTSLKTQIKKHFAGEYGYELAESAEEAWEIIEELTAEGIEIIMIVSDWLMPKIKGDEFLVQVHEKFPDIAKVMLTGQADETAIKRAQSDANLQACIYKPWQENDLIETIKKGLNKS